MKKLALVILSLLLLFTLSQCGGGKEAKNETANAGKETPGDFTGALAKYGEIVKYNEVKDSKDIKKAAQAADDAITAWSALQKSYPDKGPGVYANYKGWANTIGGINSKLGEIKTALDAGDSEKAARTCLDVEDFILAMDKDLQIVTTADKVIEMRRLLQDFKEKQGDEKKLVVTQMNDLSAKLSDTGLPKPTRASGKEEIHKQLVDSIVDAERKFAEAGDNKEVHLANRDLLIDYCAQYIVEFL
jgi:hypothetical protein